MIANNINNDDNNIKNNNGIYLNCDKKLKQLLSDTEPIGTIGSPSSTSEISLNILHNAVTKKLIGELVIFRYIQESKSHYSLGQITEIELKNVLLEDPTIKSVARQRGLVNPISGIQDTHVGKLLCSAVFSNNKDENFFETSLLGTVPATGTYIHITNDTILNSLLEKHLDKIFYLGYVYGSQTKLPMWFKHFGDGIDGAGEAYHLGIFGTTGSGKSTLAKMILMAYSKYPEMGLFVFDPVGEFSKDIISDNSNSNGLNRNSKDFNLNIKEILNSLGKKFEIVNIRNLILDRWELFEEILYESSFFPNLSIKGENKRDAVSVLINEIKNRLHINLTNLVEVESFHQVLNILRNPNIQLLIYSTSEPRARLNTVLSEIDENYLYERFWKPICQLFHYRPGAQTVDSLLKRFTNNEKPLVLIDLSLQSAHHLKLDYWNETIQALILKRILYGLINLGEKSWQQNISLNTLVVLDEAHRFARREKYENSDLENLRLTLLDAVRTTRKFGLGWMFISTSLSSVHKDILQQLRIMFCGFGLSLGSDLITLKELVSDHNALKLYQSFTDPANSFSTTSRKYSFMSQGPVSPLSFAGTPLFLNVFNSSETFVKENTLLYTKKRISNSLTYTRDDYDF
ncbi:MAG TPA: ATP-binding protein [Nitrososphaeraceae archaeon]|nr:ATP-binding protein [Nitrososphaeraceae archaeon]